MSLFVATVLAWKNGDDRCATSCCRLIISLPSRTSVSTSIGKTWSAPPPRKYGWLRRLGTPVKTVQDTKHCFGI